MPKILIVEDEAEIREELSLLLANEGYNVTAPESCNNIIQQVNLCAVDLVLLDLGLPGQDGFQLCKEIRKLSQVPIIFVTGRDGAMDELRALSLGGDDYVTKPYNIPVLLARIKAILRRTENTTTDCLEVNGLRLDLARGVLTHQDRQCEATKNELRILSCLMQRPGEIVSRTELMKFLWNSQIYIDDNTLSVNMTRLRDKLRELGLPEYITTKRGMGYRI